MGSALENRRHYTSYNLQSFIMYRLATIRRLSSYPLGLSSYPCKLIVQCTLSRVTALLGASPLPCDQTQWVSMHFHMLRFMHVLTRFTPPSILSFALPTPGPGLDVKLSFSHFFGEGFTLARQALYRLSHSTSPFPFCTGLFWGQGLTLCLGCCGLWSSYLCFLLQLGYQVYSNKSSHSLVEMGSRDLCAQAGLKPWSSWSLPFK
jgi:hypothetical protein